VRIPRNSRTLTAAETGLALAVFGSTMPPAIIVNDGLGWGDRPFTDNPSVFYVIAIGPVCYPDCTASTYWSGFGRVRDVFVHEMTHVWQYAHGYFVKINSLASQLQQGDDAYSYELGKSWRSYNVEQQATIVEDWYSHGGTADDDRFQYVSKVVRNGGDDAGWLTLEQLKNWDGHSPISDDILAKARADEMRRLLPAVII
jgi:hypothetical protein